jgi:hypothetical protein
MLNLPVVRTKELDEAKVNDDEAAADKGDNTRDTPEPQLANAGCLSEPRWFK